MNRLLHSGIEKFNVRLKDSTQNSTGAPPHKLNCFKVLVPVKLTAKIYKTNPFLFIIPKTVE